MTSRKIGPFSGAPMVGPDSVLYAPASDLEVLLREEVASNVLHAIYGAAAMRGGAGYWPDPMMSALHAFQAGEGFLAARRLALVSDQHDRERVASRLSPTTPPSKKENP